MIFSIWFSIKEDRKYFDDKPSFIGCLEEQKHDDFS
jgi:hypothetical protein